MTAEESIEFTAIAPVNIAVIKYWGKRDIRLNLPTNDSLSVTLDTSSLHTKTSVRASLHFTQDQFWLNGHEEPLLTSKRIQACLRALRAERQRLEEADPALEPRGLFQWPFHIVSFNNFPTAAGLASSASGYACLVFTTALVLGLLPATEWPQDGGQLPAALKQRLTFLSTIARQGSGSACRSLFGGYVQWSMGSVEGGEDSIAVQIAPRQHWPEMRALILVADADKKEVSSTAGMQTTVQTSTLFQERVEKVVPARIQKMRDAILKRDFAAFAELTMIDSNQFHAVCLDSFPPIFYLNQTSKAIMMWVHRLNALYQSIQQKPYLLTYTFDAGPNAVLYMLQEHVPIVSHCLLMALTPAQSWAETQLHEQLTQLAKTGPGLPWFETLKERLQKEEGLHECLPTAGVHRVIASAVGDEPKVIIDPAQSLIDDMSGLPKQMAPTS